VICTNVAALSVTSSSWMVTRESLLSTVSPLIHEMDGLGSPEATQANVIVLPASTAIVWFGRITIRAGSEKKMRESMYTTWIGETQRKEICCSSTYRGKRVQSQHIPPVAVTDSSKLTLALLSALLAVQMYCPPSASSTLQISKID